MVAKRQMRPLPLIAPRHHHPPRSSPLVTTAPLITPRHHQLNSIHLHDQQVKPISDYRCVLVRTCTATCADNCIFTRSFVLILLNLLFRLSYSNVLYLTIDILLEIDVFS